MPTGEALGAARRVRTINAISAKGLARLPKSYEVGHDVADADAWLVRSSDLHHVEIPDSVLCIARAGAGTNNIPVADLSERGVVVFNTPGANANAVKELVLLGVLLSARNVPAALGFVRNLTGDDAEFSVAVERGKKAFVGWELPDRTLGVIGLGSIGVSVANAAAALGMKVLGYDPHITIEHAWRLAPTVERASSVEEVCRKADVITVHVPLVDSTRSLINTERLALMKTRAVLLNFARSGIVDEAAVLAALDAGEIRGYVCDFPTPAAQANPKVIALPHLGASTVEAEDNCAMMAADAVADFLDNGNVHNSVNFPEAILPRENGRARVAIANRNVPHVVSTVSAVFGDAGLNIHNLLNKSRGELAYTIVDVDAEGTIPDEVLARIRASEGVLAARVC